MDMMPHRINHKNQSGNILLYILGAIFLLGLLAIMVKGSVSPGASIDRETLELRVNEVQAYGNELERAVAYVLQGGYSESDIRFAHPNASSAYGDITDIPERQIFDEVGGGATYREPPEDIQTIATDWSFNGRSVVSLIGSNTIGGSADPELIAFLPYVTKEFCLLVNDNNNITNPSDSPPQDTAQVRLQHPFDGVFFYNTTILDATDHLSGQLEGCFEGDVDPVAGTYHYYRVLLIR